MNLCVNGRIVEVALGLPLRSSVEVIVRGCAVSRRIEVVQLDGYRPAGDSRDDGHVCGKSVSGSLYNGSGS